MKNHIRRFIFAFQFMTAIPIPFELYADEEDMAGATPIFPIVGLIVGAISALIGYLAFLATDSGLLWAVSVMAAGFFLTGGLHADGLTDTFDGIFSRKPPDKMLEIMKDSRIGTFGAAALIMDFMIQFTVLITLYNQGVVLASNAVIIAHVASRLSISLSASAGQYARANGLGRGFIQLTNWKHGLWSSVAASLVFFPFMLFGFWIPLVTSLAISLGATFYFRKKLGGITGDTLGALNQIMYIVTLLSFVWQPLRWTL